MGLLSTLQLASVSLGLKLISWYAFSPIPTSADEVLQIESRDAGRTIKVNVYKPAAAGKKQEDGAGAGSGAAGAAGQPSPSPSPVLINAHGSGFVFPLHGSDDLFCRQVSQRAGYTVLDMQYRLAPGHPFPAAPHDLEDVVRWVLARPEQFDLQRFSLSGFSAGGNLALGTASAVAEFPQGTFRSVIALYPVTDLATDPGRKVAPDQSGKPIPAFVARTFDMCYIPSSADTKDPRISPSYAPPENFPDRLLVVTAACDGLAPEAEALAEKVKALPGRHVVCRRMEKCDHGWDKKAQEGSAQANARDQAYSLAVEMLSL